MPDAPGIRRRNLKLVLEKAAAGGVDAIWIARDLGYRGGRRTGLALTDESHLPHLAAHYGGIALERATRGPEVRERTATVIWDTIEILDKRIFLWNAFPLHPHEPGNSMSNRCHTRTERGAVSDLLGALLDMLSPELIISIGRDAQLALEDMGVQSRQVRHPSYGGQTEFVAGICALYGVSKKRSTSETLALPLM